MKSVSLILFLLLFFVEHSLSNLNCYDCRGCNDDFNSNNVTIVNCTETCAKTKRDDSGYVVRYCNPIPHEPECESLGSAKTWDDIAFCVCNTDLCNTASLIGRSTVTIIPASIGILCFVINFV